MVSQVADRLHERPRTPVQVRPAQRRRQGVSLVPASARTPRQWRWHGRQVHPFLEHLTGHGVELPADRVTGLQPCFQQELQRVGEHARLLRQRHYCVEVPVDA